MLLALLPRQFACLPAAQTPKQSTSGDAKLSTSSSVLNLVNCILGAGILGFAYCFKSCGIVLGVLVLVGCMLACRMSYELLLYGHQVRGCRGVRDDPAPLPPTPQPCFS